MTLRTPPPHCAETPWKEQRLAVLEALAYGNSTKRPSPFIHATTSLAKAVAIQQERGHLYSDVMVRFRPNCVGPGHWLGYTHDELRNSIVEEMRTDDPDTVEMVKRIRGFMTKDEEVIVKQRPDLKDVEFWNGDAQCWSPALSFVPRMTVFGAFGCWVVGEMVGAVGSDA